MRRRRASGSLVPKTSSPAIETTVDNSGLIEAQVGNLVEDLKGTSFDAQRDATFELRLLAKQSMENRIVIANCGAISLLVDLLRSLIHVLETGGAEAKENSAATLFSLSVIEDNKVRIGRSGAIGPLVDLLGNGTPRGRKDAATALFSLSIFHENRRPIVQAGAIKYLVELMDPAAGLVDKVVAVLANLSTIPVSLAAVLSLGKKMTKE